MQSTLDQTPTAGARRLTNFYLKKTLASQHVDCGHKAQRDQYALQMQVPVKL